MSESIFKLSTTGHILENGQDIHIDRVVELLNTVPSVIDRGKDFPLPGSFIVKPLNILNSMTVWDWYAGQALSNGQGNCSDAAMRADKMMILRKERKK